MSLFVWQVPGLAMGPRFKVKEGQLRSRSNLVFCLLTLGLYFKRVVIDTEREVIVIRRRVLWFIKFVREVRFSEIKRIDYSYEETVTSWNSLGWTTDAVDKFKVSLVLHDESWVKLWTFVGEGSGQTGLLGVWMGDEEVDFEGSQESDSLYFVELMQYFTGKPLTRYS